MNNFSLELYLEMMQDDFSEYSNDVVEKAYQKAFIEQFN